MNSISLKCNAKINLSLDVIGKREDGYHNIELVFLEINLADEVTVSLRDDGNIKLICNDPTLPSDDKNIAYKAAALFFSEYGKNYGADIILKKNIPHGAGLAGGSADAAGVLRALNILLSEPFSKEKLMRLGTKLGADVPFWILGGCAFAVGIGDILTPLPKPDGLYYVLVKPEQSISTAYLYQNLDLNKRTDTLNEKNVVNAIKSNDKNAFYKYAGNIMETVTASKFPIINKIKETLIKNGSKKALMSGSGTTVFGIFESLSTAKNVAELLKKEYKNVYLA